MKLSKRLALFFDYNYKPDKRKCDECYKHGSQANDIWPVILCIETECGQNSGSRDINVESKSLFNKLQVEHLVH